MNRTKTQNKNRALESCFVLFYCFSVRSQMSIGEFDGPPSWSLDASETKESTKCPWREARTEVSRRDRNNRLKIQTFGFLCGLCHFFWSQRRALLFPIAKIELIITHDFLILFQISRSRKYLNSTPLEIFSNVSTQTARNHSPASHAEH